MGASFSAEFLKLSKRPATWVLALVWLTLVVLFGYVLTYLVFADMPQENLPPGTDPDAFLRVLFPENVLSNVLAGFSSTGGGPVALILGALAVGGEYGWGTLKTTFTQGPGRVGVLLGKVLMLGCALVGFVVLAFASGAATSLVIARIEDVPVNWPPMGETLRAFVAGFLILAVWTALGVALAVLFRGTPFAVGLGLIYALLLEGIAGTLLAANADYEAPRKFLLNENSNALINAFGSATPAALGPPDSIVEPWRAVLTLSTYAIVFVGVAALSWRWRDVA